VSLGFFNKRFGVTGPYVSPLDPERIRDSGADYLVFHRDVRAEVQRYGDFVQPGSKSASLVRVPSPKKVLRLRQILGAPTHESEALLVWKLPPAGAAD
jgi:hypothetical protein